MLKNKPILFANLLYGATVGIIFALVFWGYDAFLLSQAHAAYAWLPLVIGLMFSSVIFTLVALLTYLANKSIVGLIIWVMAARLVIELTIAIPIKITPIVMKILEPELAAWIPSHAYNTTFKVWISMGFLWLAIFSGILGLMQLILVEQIAHVSIPFKRVSPYVLISIIMLIGSLVANNLINEQFRSPILAINGLVNFAVDNKDIDVEPILARQMHLGALGGVRDFLKPSFRLFLGGYDDTFSQVDVLIDFDGKWILCSTVNGTPTYCRMTKFPLLDHNFL